MNEFLFLSYEEILKKIIEIDKANNLYEKTFYDGLTYSELLKIYKEYFQD